jgi:3-hydroxy-9,10-secoandrosta-1,3,5(10)-triene-9,17-dione monooxygenase reductase component
MTAVAAAVSAMEFRRACGRFVTGVAVVTACHRETAVGMTINSFSSVSLDPPLVLWSLRNGASSRRIFENAGMFAISILSSEQASLARRFAAGNPEVFSSAATLPSPSGLPLIAGAITHMECATYDVRDGGDHRIVLGSVNSLAVHEGSPLLFYNGHLLSGFVDVEQLVKS